MLLPLVEVRVHLVHDIGGKTGLMLAGAGDGDDFGGLGKGILIAEPVLLHHAHDLVFVQHLLILLGAVGGTDHGQAHARGLTIFDHLQAFGCTALIHLIFPDHDVQDGGIALRQRGSGADNEQQVQLKIVKMRPLSLRQVLQGLFYRGLLCAHLSGAAAHRVQRSGHHRVCLPIQTPCFLQHEISLDQKA